MEDERQPILQRSMEAGQRSKWRTQVACGCVLLTKTFERIAFYGVVLHEGPHVTRQFFNWFYWCINCGCLVSLGLIAYVQQNISFFWGFLVPGICLLVGIVIFVIGRFFYVVKPASGSVLSSVFRILVEGCNRSRKSSKRRNSDSSHSPEPVGCLGYAKVRNGGSHNETMVDDVRILFKIILIFTAMIPYWLVYFQMETTYTIQGLHMRLSFGGSSNNNTGQVHKSPIAAAWLSLFDVIFLVVLIPIMDQLVYPALDRRGIVLSLRTRITIGMFFSVASVLVAGGVESHRLYVYQHNGTYNQTIGNTTFQAADVSVFLQVPQYALIGISEVFASIAGLELAYALAPRSMQGLIMGLFSFTQGIASLLGTAILYAFRGTWFFDYDHGDINCYKNCKSNSNCHCHLDYYFYFLGGLQCAGLVGFVILSRLLNIGGPKEVKQPITSTPPVRRRNPRYFTVQHRSTEPSL